MINNKYYRIPKKKEVLEDYEVFVTAKQDPMNFLRYAVHLFDKKNFPFVKLKASGSAISSLVNVSEILKKVVPSLHQCNRMYTMKYVQEYAPKEKGLDHVSITRNVPVLEISFYKVLIDPAIADEPGYQPPLPEETFEKVKLDMHNLVKKQITFKKNNYNQSNQRGNYRGGQRGNYRGEQRGNYRGGQRGNYRGEQRGNYRGGQRGNFRENNEGQPEENVGNYREKKFKNDWKEETEKPAFNQKSNYGNYGKYQGNQDYKGKGNTANGSRFGVYHSKFDDQE